MNSFYFDKMHMLYTQNKSCVKSCQNIAFFKKTLFSKKNHCFPKKPIVFQHVHFFNPIVLRRKIITGLRHNYFSIIALPAIEIKFSIARM